MSVNSLQGLTNGLIKQFNAGRKLEELQSYVASYSGDDWKSYRKLDKNSYCRSLVTRNILFEILLIGWGPRQVSPIHDHPKSGCILRVMKGEITEQLFSKDNLDEPTDSRLAEVDSVSYLEGDKVLHKISNDNNFPSFTLHVYSPPNYVPNKFD